MTIYYVDPVNGANTNSGLSWALAWRWPPGNGVTINPGDEIRVAKSPTVDGSYNYSFDGSSISATSYGYGYGISYSSLFTPSLAGVTTNYGQIIIAPGTVVPANTKLCYITLTTTALTTYATIDVKLQTRGVPTGAAGQYLRFALCSDTLGATPVAWLDGPTIQGDDASYQPNSITAFLIASASNLNLSVSSIAFYSGSSSFTAPSYGVLLDTGYGLSCSGISTAGAYLRPGGFYRHDTTDVPTLPTLGATPVDGFGMGRNSNGSTLYFTPPLKTSPQTYAYYGYYHYTQLTIYLGLPNPHLVYSTYEAGLTFSGTAELPINISGGWDTATNTQTSYTNLDLDLVLHVKRRGAFVFSSGGQYVRFSRFFSVRQPIVYYDYALSTLQEAMFYDCTYGCPEYSSGIGTSLMGVSTASTSLTINKMWTERCTSYGLATVHRGPVYYFNSGSVAEQYAAGQLIFGTIDAVDCLICRPYFISPYYKYTTHFKMRSSVPGSVRSIVVSMYGQIDLTLSPSATAVFEVSDTAWSGYLSSFTPDTADGPSNFDVVLRNLWLTEYTPYSGTNYIAIKYARSVLIDGASFYTGYASGMIYLQLYYTDTWNTNNPSGANIMLSGQLAVRGNSYYNAIQYYYPPLLVDGSSYTYTAFGSYSYPTLDFAKVAPGTVLRNLRASAIVINPKYVDGTTPYYQEGNDISLYNCTGLLITPTTTPLGSIRAYDGVVATSAPYAAVPSYYSAANGVWPGIALYNYTIEGFSSSSPSSGYGYMHQENLAVDLMTTGPVRPSGGTTDARTGQTYYVKDSVTLDADYLFNNLSSYGTGNARGMLWRKADGTFLFKAGANIAAAAPPSNVYGKYPLRIIGSHQIAALDVIGGTTVTFTVRFKSTAASGYFMLSVPPSLAYTTDLHGHVSRKNITTNEVDILHSFSISPTADGTIHVAVFANVTITIKDFTVTVQ